MPSARVEKHYDISITGPGSTDTSHTSLYVGSTHGDTITGTSANDIIVSGPGNDMLQGGGGSDVFVFNPRFGKDTIADFTSGDVLAFDKSIVSSAADVFKHASQVGADTLIALAWAKAAASGIDTAIELMAEALKIQRAKLPPTDPAIQETEKRLAIFQAMARADSGE